MKVQLLLLVALAGPFCAVTSAIPTFPTELLSASPQDNQATAADSPVLDPASEVITGPPPTVPEALPEIVPETQPAASVAPTTRDEPFVFTESRGVFTTPVTEIATQVAETEAPVLETEAPVLETEAPVVETETPIVETEAPVVETEAPVAGTEAPAVKTSAPDAVTDPAAPDAEASAAPVEEQTASQLDGDVTVVEDSLSSGQIIGIVIGALLAVVIVIAVVIAVVRRMGKYSSAKSRKTAKKDSAVASPLRKKPTKQKQSAKFWKN
ncbi:hypothetical protein OJAV_G00063850 [Oryzias javanicus]|uniref:Uncharacterized protein n=1 Tax=Oryzias javanicus TaxID=123683 RepID=A0A3S2PUZ2_ORYJA|nr:hypothetical protein OJAV_G00063850 [Oryzias javanicus]